MKKLFLSLSIIVFALACFAQQTIDLNSWKFKSGDSLAWAKPGYDDSEWEPINVGSNLEGYNGYAWYRIKFRLPSVLKENALFKDTLLFVLGRIYGYDQTFLNGTLIGQNANPVPNGNIAPLKDLSQLEEAWTISRKYSVAVNDPRLLWNKENVLSIRIHHYGGGGGFATLPVNARMKDVNEYIAFDIDSRGLETKPDGTISKIITLKNLSPLAVVKGRLTMEIANADSKQVIATQTYNVSLKRDETPFIISFKGDLTQRMKATYTFTESKSSTEVFRTQALPFSPNNLKPEEVSGEYYDWTKTLQPESPWNYDYNKTLVIKINSRGFKRNNRFNEAFNVIRRIDNITLGLPRIAYLVGFMDADPSWDTINKCFKRNVDPVDLDSLKWLIKAAKSYNTTISLHINLIDIFDQSPLWQEYLDKDIVTKDNMGEPIKGESWGGPRSYQLSYTQEWKLGYLQKRIYYLLEMLPELRGSGTIHIDAFHSMRPSGVNEPISPYLGTTIEDEISTQRKIFRYLRKYGIDVTCEGAKYWLRKDPFLGLQAATWWFDELTFAREDWTNKPKDFSSLPATLSCYTPMHCEEEVMKDPVNLPGLTGQVCLNLVPWYHKRNPDVAMSGTIIITDDEVICPILWKDRAMVAYNRSADIRDRKVKLPTTWVDVKEVQLCDLTLEGLKPRSVVNVTDGIIYLTINKDQPTVIMPIGVK